MDTVFPANIQKIRLRQDSLCSKGRELLAAGRPQEALVVLQEIAGQDPDNVRVLHALSEAQIETGALTQGLASLVKAFGNNPMDKGLVHSLSKALRQAGERDQAGAVLQAYAMPFGKGKSYPPASMDVSIFLPTKERSAQLMHFLESIPAAGKGLSVEVLVLAAQPDAELFAKAEKGEIRLFEEKRFFTARPSWPEMMNFMLLHAKGRFFMYGSDDIVLQPGAFDHSLDSMAPYGDQAAGAAMAYRNMGSKTQWREYGIDLTLGRRLLINYGLIRTAYARDAGGFSNDYNFYCADGDMCFRLLQAGRDLIPAFKARVDHHHVMDGVKQGNKAVVDKDIATYHAKWLDIFGPLDESQRRVFTHDDLPEEARPRMPAAQDQKRQWLEKVMAHASGKEAVRLHLGCGQNYFEGYVNIDFPSSEHNVQTRSVADFHADLLELDLPAGTVDEIRSHHVFEHFDRPSAMALLVRWHRWLKIGGRLVIETPDVEESFRQVLGNGDFTSRQAVMRHVFGSHEASWAIHFDGWDAEKFHKTLRLFGFEVSVENSQWKRWPHLANVTATAVKAKDLNVTELQNAVRTFHSWHVVSQGESELRMLTYWIERTWSIAGEGDVLPVEQNKANIQTDETGACVAIVFSKDRAMQLDACLRSLAWAMAGQEGEKDVRVRVLYAASSPGFAAQYAALAQEHPNVDFHRETDFKADLLALVADAGQILFLVDDNVFTRPFSPATVVTTLSRTPQAIGFSLRLGRNIVWHYQTDTVQPQLPLTPLQGDVLGMVWPRGKYAFNYPLEVSSSVYLASLMRPLLESLEYKNPNTLELQLSRQAKQYAKSHPVLLTYDLSRAFCIPLNLVQSDYANKYEATQQLDVAHLAALFDKGLRIDLSTVQGAVPTSCHQYFPLRFTPVQTGDKTGVDAARPFISVCIPTYNRAGYLPQAVQSALDQEYGDFEVLVVDDGSTDETASILRSIDNPHLRYVHKEHSGRAASRDVCVQEAKGDFILWLDSDDLLAPGILQHYAAMLAENSAMDVLYGNLIKVDDALRPTGVVQYADWSENPSGLLEAMLYKNQIPNPGTLVRKSLFAVNGGFDLSFPFCEDYEWFVRVADKARFKHCHRPSCLWRRHPEAVAATQEGLDNGARVVERIMKSHDVSQLLARRNNGETDTPAGDQAAELLIKVVERFLTMHCPHHALPYVQGILDLNPGPQYKQKAFDYLKAVKQEALHQKPQAQSA